MFRTTLAHVTRWVKSGFKSQLRNHRIADINVENERQSWSTFHFFSSRDAERSIKPKGVERPKLPTIRHNNKRYPSHYACSTLSAKSPGTTLGLGTCRCIQSQMADLSKRRIPPPDLKSKRLCTSSSGVRLANTHIKDTESIQHVVQANSSTSVEGARPQSKVHSLSPNTPRIPDMHRFWSHRMYKTPDGNDISVHYCKTLESAESVAKHFLDDEVLGFDMEWKASVSAADTIQNNVSLIQLASPTRIALFHIAMFKPARAIEDLTPPTLKRILESPHVRKVGVSIKADCTRLRKFLKIDTCGIFELSHLYKLVKYCQTNPELINKRLVNLSTQVEEHFGLPLAKDAEVRCSDWASSLNYSQVQCKSYITQRYRKV
ncbi:ribonuclease H-like domain-containing protein [Aspergillus alliaceus]|uniref:Ribonuclease H-like domain-containing protein n=1 Tax=Petromyces alliaceus TaxID=209559 RepID=A0A5N7C6N1_PETAA|nr:ribonuclease H-like domain-containing protein [Aspergillus alliaceus]